MLASLTEAEQAKILDGLTEEDLLELLYDWDFWARPKQIEPSGDWLRWLLDTGRGWGKTLVAGKTLQKRALTGKGLSIGRIALVAPTAADARDTMVEGESGILENSHPNFTPIYQPSKRKLTWPNGVTGHLFSSEEPRRLRGPQFDLAWCEEAAHWENAQETWDMLMFGLRHGSAQAIVTSTPRPTPLIKWMIKDPDTHLTMGSTFENQHNLSANYFKVNIQPYIGTRLGRQELYGELLEDVPGALWNYEMIDNLRVAPEDAPDMVRIVVAIDPAITSDQESAETGIIIAGKSADGHGYVLGDFTIRASPDGWAKETIRAFDEFEADRIIGEVNQGGDMVEMIIRNQAPNIPYRGVHASRSKVTRAEPIAALYEQGLIHHVGGLGKLEDQMIEFVGGERHLGKDRVDALVWAFTELLPRIRTRMPHKMPDDSHRIRRPTFAGVRTRTF